jgi:hypothetical protein
MTTITQTSRVARRPATGHVWTALSAIALVTGILLRAYHLFQQRSFWIDEARLALGIRNRGYLELLQPLPYDQSAPPGFLWAVRSLAAWFGGSEAAFRVLPFLAGTAGLLVFWRVNDRLLANPKAKTLAVAWVSLGPQFILYSDELKPYSVDLLVNVLILWAAVNFLAGPEQPRKSVAWLTLLAIAAPWFSTPAIFTLVAAAMAIFLHGASVGRRASRLPILSWALGAMSAIGAYALAYRTSGTNEYLREYWDQALVRITHAGGLGRLGFGLQDLISGTFLGVIRQGLVETDLRGAVLAFTLVMVPLVGFGWRSIARERGVGIGVLVGGPPALAILSSLVGIYPLAFRLMLFGAPALLWCAAAGLTSAISPDFDRRGWIWALVGLVLFEVPLQRDLNDLSELTHLNDMRSAVAFVRQTVGRREGIYVLPGGLPAWVYYTTNWVSPDTARLRLAERMGSSGGAAFENSSASSLPNDTPDSLLEWSRGEIRELWGKAAGVQFKQGTDSLDTTPARQWATREGARIQQAGPVTWIVMSFTPPYGSLLFDRLREYGGQLRVTYHTSDILVVRCAFAEPS